MLHITQAGLQNGDVELLARSARSQHKTWPWPVPRTAHPGDDAVLFVQGHSFVATGKVVSVPRPSRSWANRYASPLAEIEMIEPALPLELIQKRVPQLAWGRYPRGMNTPPENVSKKIRALIRQHRKRPTVRDSLVSPDTRSSSPSTEGPGYFVLKGVPANDWKRMLRPSSSGSWRTARAPSRTWRPGDRLFCWESGSRRRLVGLASLTRTDAGVDDGDRLFRVRYLTRLLDRPVTIEELRSVPALREASFLKSGPAMTLFRLTLDQAAALFRIVADRNPEVAPAWPDLVGAPPSGALPDLDDVAATEGSARMRQHLVRERDRRLVLAKRAAVLRKTRRLGCEACDRVIHRSSENVTVARLRREAAAASEGARGKAAS